MQNLNKTLLKIIFCRVFFPSLFSYYLGFLIIFKKLKTLQYYQENIIPGKYYNIFVFSIKISPILWQPIQSSRSNYHSIIFFYIILVRKPILWQKGKLQLGVTTFNWKSLMKEDFLLK